MAIRMCIGANSIFDWYKGVFSLKPVVLMTDTGMLLILGREAGEYGARTGWAGINGVQR